MSPPGLVSALRRSIEREGLLRALLVNLESDGKLVLLDGFKRLRALRELGHEQAEMRIVELDEPAARAAMLAYNTPHRGLCELEQSWVHYRIREQAGEDAREVLRAVRPLLETRPLDDLERRLARWLAAKERKAVACSGQPSPKPARSGERAKPNRRRGGSTSGAALGSKARRRRSARKESSR